MLVSFVDLLSDRQRSGKAIGAFTCYDLETARAVLAAANDAPSGVILLISREAFAEPGGDQLAVAIRAAAERASAAACVQLDHVADIELVAAAFDAGCGAVMVDGSRLPLDENVAVSAQAAELARRAGGAIEVELGHVSGDEDIATAAAAGKLTEPAVVPRFLAETGAACLAVSIGNAHGEYRTPPVLDWERLEAIRRLATVPLSLHGASGLPRNDLGQAIALGIAKINVNTDLRRAYLTTTAESAGDHLDGLRLLALHRQQMEAVRIVAGAKLNEFDPALARAASGE